MSSPPSPELYAAKNPTSSSPSQASFQNSTTSTNTTQAEEINISPEPSDPEAQANQAEYMDACKRDFIAGAQMMGIRVGGLGGVRDGVKDGVKECEGNTSGGAEDEKTGEDWDGDEAEMEARGRQRRRLGESLES